MSKSDPRSRGHISATPTIHPGYPKKKPERGVESIERFARRHGWHVSYPDKLNTRFTKDDTWVVLGPLGIICWSRNGGRGRVSPYDRATAEKLLTGVECDCEARAEPCIDPDASDDCPIHRGIKVLNV